MNIIGNIKTYAEKSPDKIAYKINNEILTYKELEDKSNALAKFLQKKADGDMSPIIVYGHKSKYMLIAFLATVKTGRAYCPIDISVPMERTSKIINSVNPKIILTTENIESNDERIVDINEIQKHSRTNNKIDEKFYVKNDDVFYIIFTSGSTGVPKGVQITLECLNNFLKWSTKLVEKDDNLIFLNQAPFSFDLSVMDLYTSLAVGGTLIGIDKSTQNNMLNLFNLFKKSNANVWVSTPSFINMCLADKSFNKELLPKIQTFLFCGETLPTATAKKILERFKNSKVINTYGPTESTVAVTSVNINQNIIEKSETASLPIGVPKENTFVFIQNEKHENLPEDQKGEIVIVGDTVSIGYFNNIEKTKKVFETYEVNGNKYRAYRTGDMGYFHNGQLYYCGRIDFQIKLHGYRIEIEDIESNILKYLDVRNVAVVPVYDEGGITVKYLQAFIESNNNMYNGIEGTLKIKGQLKKYLPDYMIPKKIKFIDKIPMTNNSKIDRKALKGIEK